MDDRVESRYYPAPKILVTSLEGTIDDALLASLAQHLVALPQFNRCSKRIVDLWICTPGALTVAGIRSALGIVARKSGVGVRMVFIARSELLTSVERHVKSHAGSLPVEFASSRAEVERLASEPHELCTPEGADGSTSAFDKFRTRLEDPARKTLVSSITSTKASAPEIFRDMERHLDGIDGDLRDMYLQAKRATDDGHTFAAMATLLELIKRLVDDADKGLPEAVMRTVTNGELTRYLEPMLRLHDKVLQSSSVGRAELGEPLLRLATVLLLYRRVLPQWVATYFDPLIASRASTEQATKRRPDR